MDLLQFNVPSSDKYALAVMDALFTEEELGSHCYTNSTKKKPPLSKEKVSLLEGTYNVSNLWHVCSNCSALLCRVHRKKVWKGGHGQSH